MATDVERLLLRLEVTQTKFDKQMARASGTANKRARQIETRFDKMNKNVTASLKRTATGLLAPLAAGAVAREFVQLTDANKRITNALKVTGLEGERLDAVYERLFASAQKNYAPVEALTTLYGRAALVQGELGVSTQELLGFTDNVAIALRVAGTSAAESSGALLQLSQALGAGVVRAEEFNSILEGAPTIARAVALGLEEAGGSVAKLRQLVIDGKISSEVFFRAFEAGAPALASQVAGASVTADQALTNLQTALTKAAGEFDDTVGASDAFVDAIDSFAGAVPNFARGAESLIGSITSISDAYEDGVGKILAFARAVGEASGLANIGRQARADGFLPALPTKSPDEIRNGLAAAAKAPLEVAVVTPISAANFDAPVKKGGGGGAKRKAGSAGRKSGSAGSGAARESDLQREIKSIRERTAAIQAETAAQASVNPLIEDYGFAVEKARLKQDLLTAAMESGVKVTPELDAQMDALAEGYASASVQAQQLAESQDKVRQKAEEFQALGKDVARGFIDDLRSGKTAAEALEGALGKVADKLLDIALNSVFDGGGGSGGFGGLISGLFGGGGSSASRLFKAGKGGLFAEGGYTGSGGKYEPAGIVHKGEYVVPADVVKKVGVPNLERLRGYANGGLVGGGRSAGGAATAPTRATYHIDARGAQQGVGAEIRAALEQYDRNIAPRRAVASVQAFRRAGGSI